LVKSIKQKTKGISTIGGRNIYYDDVIGRLNSDSRGLELVRGLFWVQIKSPEYFNIVGLLMGSELRFIAET
jgi:hypothetical protein